MNILEIYNKYHLPENLQMHMLRVAACANFILDNWKGKPIDRKAITRVSLLHDMGNMVKIPEEEIQNQEFRKIRRKYYEIYGTNDHEINMLIGKEEGLTDKELEILDGKRSRKNEQTARSDNYEIKICAYCDQRVAPDGVVSLKERLENAKKRYKDRPLSVWSNEEKANQLIKWALQIEEQIMKYCKRTPEDINNQSIQAYIDRLKEYEI